MNAQLPDSGDLFLEAVNAAVTIEEPADAANVLLQITTALFEAGNTDYAHALLQKSFRRIRELDDPKERSYLLRLFVTLQCRQGLVDAAAETLPQIDDSEQRAVALKELAMANVKAGRLDDARKIAEEEIEDNDDYEAVLAAIGEERPPEAEMMPNISLESARKIDDVFHRSTVLRQIGTTLHQNGKPSEARAVFKETLNAVRQIRNSYSRTNSLTDFAVDLANTGIDDGAIKVFRLAVDAAQEIENVSFALPCLCRIVECQTSARFFDEAFDAVNVIEDLRDEIPRKSSERGPFDRDFSPVLGKLAVGLADSAEFEEESIPLLQKALDIARNIGDAQCRAIALMRLAYASGSVRFA